MSRSLRQSQLANTLVFLGATAACALWIRQDVPGPVMGVVLAAGCVYALGLVLLWRAHRGWEPRSEDLEVRAERLQARAGALEGEIAEGSEEERSLRRSEENLAKALRMAKVGDWCWSAARQELVKGADEYARIFGWDPEDVPELLKHEVDRVVHPDDRERVRRAFPECEDLGSGYEIEYRTVHPDGGIRHVLEVGEASGDGSGGLFDSVGTVQDVTDLKRAEEALRQDYNDLAARIEARTAKLREREALLRNAARLSKMGTAIWDEVAQRYASVSEEYAHIFGCGVEEYLERYGTHETDIHGIHPDDRDRYEAFDRAYRASPHEAEVEYRVAIPGRPVQYVRDVVQPVYDDAGRLVQTVIAVQDITESKHTEEQLRQAQKMEAVGQLTGGVAHDFNNLLAVILGNLELLEGEVGKDGEAPEWIRAAIAAAERGANLTQRLLAFSRKQALRPEPVDAHELVRDMHDLLRRTLDETIEIEVVGGADLWLSRVDRGQLENSILNLAINARDAMSGGGKLTIETSNVWIEEDFALEWAAVKPGPYVRLVVVDTGAGMPAEVASHAFEPFFTTKDVGEGSGLGLSMVYGFVKQSDGHVKIASEEGRGTAVELYLPRCPCSDEATAGRAKQEGLPRARGEVVLVVEDDVDVRALALRILVSLGYSVREASSASAALDVLDSRARVDLLLTDVVLPAGMSGRELAEEASRRRPGLPVMYMSGYTEDAIIRHGRLEEGVQFLQKPFRIADMARAVREALAAASS